MSLKKVIKKGMFKIRSFNSSRRKLPEFIILGTQKGGTTSLSFYLAQHPEIFFPMAKEVHFFDLHYKNGLDWYRTYFPLKSSRKISGEATPYYMFHPHVPIRIKKDVPNAKFIVLLRDPVSRAYSHFVKETTEGHDDIKSFDEAFYAEKERISNETKRLMNDVNYYSLAHQRYTYFSRGLYYKQIKYWFDFFDKHQFLFLKSEDLFTDPKSELKKVYDFLGVSEVYPKNLAVRNRGNKSENENTKNPLFYEYFEEDLKQLQSLLGEKFRWE